MKTLNYHSSPIFVEARQKAIGFMSPVHDPFHDDQHILEVVKTAHKIIDSLNERDRKKVNTEVVELAVLYHDTSRVKIGSNLIAALFFDEKYSGDIAYASLIEVGYPTSKADEVKEIIRGHAKVSGLGRDDDINSQVLSDADKVEVFNPKRFERGLQRFEDGQFP